MFRHENGSSGGFATCAQIMQTLDSGGWPSGVASWRAWSTLFRLPRIVVTVEWRAPRVASPISSAPLILDSNTFQVPKGPAIRSRLLRRMATWGGQTQGSYR